MAERFCDAHGEQNMSLKLIQSTGEFIAEHEVVLQVLGAEEISGIEAGLSTISDHHILFSTTHSNGGSKGEDSLTIFSQDIAYSAWRVGGF